jgi:hypothetical protein
LERSKKGFSNCENLLMNFPSKFARPKNDLSPSL